MRGSTKEILNILNEVDNLVNFTARKISRIEDAMERQENRLDEIMNKKDYTGTITTTTTLAQSEHPLIKETLSSLHDFLQEKNRRYGSSVMEPLEGTEISAEMGIKVRLADKVKRVINSKELRKNDVVDILGYMVFLCIVNDWTNFDDLID